MRLSRFFDTKSRIRKIVLFFVLLIYYGFVDAQIHFDAKNGTMKCEDDFSSEYFSPIADGKSVLVKDMVQMNFKKAISLNGEAGIIADLGERGRVELRVYSTYKGQDGKVNQGKKIFQGYIDQSSSSYSIKPADETSFEYMLDLTDLYLETHCTATDIGCRVQEAGVYKEECVIEKHAIVSWWSFFFGLTFKDVKTCQPIDFNQPVVISLEIFNATVKSIKIPGVATTKLINLFDYPFDFESFAVIGNYGCASKVGGNTEENVASMINNNMDHWHTKPDFILSLGNDSYHELSPQICGGTSFDENVGKFFQSYIKPYTGSHGSGSQDVNRFYPVPGQMDYDDKNGTVLTDLSGEEKWQSFFSKTDDQTKHYDFVRGDVHFFALNTNNRTGTSTDPTADQNSSLAQWLKGKLESSKSKYKVVYFHHPPYASGVGDANGYSVLRWPFKNWGADIVFSGGAGFYERHVADGMTYIVNGAGGRGITHVSSANYAPTLVKGTHIEKYGAVVSYPMGKDLIFRFQDSNEIIHDEFVLFQDGTTFYDERKQTPLTQLPKSEKTDLFLILGQSNTGGRCEEASTDYGRCPYLSADQISKTNVFLLNEKNRFEAATNPINKYSTVELVSPAWQTVSVGWTFGPKVYESTGTRIGLISNARGGLRWETWQKDWNIRTDQQGKTYETFLKKFLKREYKGENPYNEALNRVTAALDYYNNSELKGILMLQGEWTAAFIWPGGKPSSQQKTSFFSQLDTFINDLRTDLKTHTGKSDYSKMPWFIAELRQDVAAPDNFMKTTGMNEALNEYAKTRTDVYIVPSKDLVVNKDGVHYNYSSQKILGERLADAYLATINSNARLFSQKKEIEDSSSDLNTDFQIYPNPAGNYIEVDLNNAAGGYIEASITDLQGHVIKIWKVANEGSTTQKKKSGSSKFIINNLDDLVSGSGVYLLKIKTQDFEESKKFIVR